MIGAGQVLLEGNEPRGGDLADGAVPVVGLARPLLVLPAPKMIVQNLDMSKGSVAWTAIHPNS